jgi:hypothetical protein
MDARTGAGWRRAMTAEDVVAVYRLTILMVSGVGLALGMMPDTALAEIPIPGLDTRVTDVGDLMTGNGGLIATGLGAGAAALKMIASRAEAGIGDLFRTGMGGAIFGATPEIQDYVLT